MLDSETKRKIDSARDILVGVVPDPKSQVEQITTALIYKFMDDMDKEAQEFGGEATFFANGFAEFAWPKLLDSRLSGVQRLDLYVRAIDAIPKNPSVPPLFCDIFKGAFLTFRNPETLTLFLRQINEFAYDHSERLGDAFEYLLSILGSQGAAGQFRTPRHVIDFIVDVVSPKKNESILDPACGTAGFLISAYKHIAKNHDGKDNQTGKPTDKEAPLTMAEKNRLMRSLVGYDISPDMARLAKVNLYLHGFNQPNIAEYDTLTSEERWGENFHVILANPPFMNPIGGIRPHGRFGVQANRAEVLFVDYIAEHLLPNGRAGVIVPEGVIFQSANAYKRLRQNLLENWGLYAVISLPNGVFNPYSGVKTSILLLDKGLAKKHDQVLFVTVQNDGYDLGARRGKIDKNDLPQALRILRQWQRGQGVAADCDKLVHAVSREKIAAGGDYNLTGDRYREAIDYRNAKWQMVDLATLEQEGKIEFLRGQGLSKKETVKKGRNKCILYGEIYTLYDPVIKHIVSRTDYEGKILSCAGDVLLPSTTTADALGIAVARSLNEDGVIIGGDINIVRTRNKHILSDFLSWQISASPAKKQLAAFAKGVNILHISNKDIRQLKIPLPPLEVQQQIVVEIEGYQRVINGARQVVESWNPNFRIDPDWPLVALGDVAEVIAGQSPEGIHYNATGEGMPFYQGKAEFGDMYVGKPKKWTTCVTKEAGKGDILMSVRAPVGPVNIAVSRICIGRGLAGIRGKDGEIDQFYLFHVLRLKESEIIGNSGATFPSINRSDIEKIQIPIPPLDGQKRIVTEIETEQKAVDECRALITRMEQKIKAKIAEIWESGAPRP